MSSNSSSPRVRALALGVSLAALAGTVALCDPAVAQTDATPQPAPAPAPPQPTVQTGGVVSRIIVQGNERIDSQTISSYLPIAVGDVVDGARIDLAIKTLFRTELFSDVQITLSGSDLTVKVVENPIVNQVVFEGNHALAETKLRDEVTIHPRSVFTKARVQQDVSRIIELYRRAGRINATVTPKIVELPQKRVDLIFEINEGSKTGISRINVLGNKAFSDSQLRDVVVTKESNWWRFLSSNTNYDPDRLDYDREQLSKYYTNRGYYDFRVTSAVAELKPDQKNFDITFTVDEGRKYTFGDIKVVTENKKLDADFLKALLPIHKGQLFQSDRVEDAIDSLTFAAGSAGYAFVNVRPRETPNREKRTVDLVFDVREGPHIYVQRIDIIGNTRTIDPVIRRELLMSEGDAYNKVLLDRSRNQIRALGFFKDVSIKTLPGDSPDKTVVQVQVEEQPTGEFSFGVGFSSIDKFLFDVGVTERNFRGRGEQLRLRAQTGSLSQTVDASFTEPHWLGRNLQAGYQAFSYRYDFANEADFTSTSTGAGVHIGFPINYNTYLNTHYQILQNGVQVDAVVCASDEILCQQRGYFWASQLGYSLKTDRRNDPLFPTRGWKGTFSQDFAGIGGQVKYLKSEGDFTYYWGFNRNWVFTVQGQAGYVHGWDGDAVRINDRFFKGGDSFRGFQVAGIGPRDTGTHDALGGNMYAIGTVEFAFPNGLPEEYGIKTALFTDFGTEGQLDAAYKRTSVTTPNDLIKDDLALRASAGLSIKWKSPMGPVEFDLSQILAKTDYDKTELFRFSTYAPF
ncbi:MAG TPA: outer membrane protein assembly factor BamA [Caulobacteraceae bacterium]|jgi:outer membrane protein insertion porin family|nr:outer membrane protein assembly factor BamA [Caulobacteraceae bacterium]